jgi:hypothetical protein
MLHFGWLNPRLALSMRKSNDKMYSLKRKNIAGDWQKTLMRTFNDDVLDWHRYRKELILEEMERRKQEDKGLVLTVDKMGRPCNICSQKEFERQRASVARRGKEPAAAVTAGAPTEPEKAATPARGGKGVPKRTYIPKKDYDEDTFRTEELPAMPYLLYFDTVPYTAKEVYMTIRTGQKKSVTKSDGEARATVVEIEHISEPAVLLSEVINKNYLPLFVTTTKEKGPTNEPLYIVRYVPREPWRVHDALSGTTAIYYLGVENVDEDGNLVKESGKPVAGEDWFRKRLPGIPPYWNRVRSSDINRLKYGDYPDGLMPYDLIYEWRTGEWRGKKRKTESKTPEINRGTQTALVFADNVANIPILRDILDRSGKVDLREMVNNLTEALRRGGYYDADPLLSELTESLGSMNLAKFDLPRTMLALAGVRKALDAGDFPDALNQLSIVRANILAIRMSDEPIFIVEIPIEGNMVEPLYEVWSTDKPSLDRHQRPGLKVVR